MAMMSHPLPRGKNTYMYAYKLYVVLWRRCMALYDFDYKLDPKNKARYFEKIALIGKDDPYALVQGCVSLATSLRLVMLPSCITALTYNVVPRPSNTPPAETLVANGRFWEWTTLLHWKYQIPNNAMLNFTLIIFQLSGYCCLLVVHNKFCDFWESEELQKPPEFQILH